MCKHENIITREMVEEARRTSHEYEEAYFRSADSESSAFGSDLLSGKTRIYDVPEKYRDSSVYIYAMKWARTYCPKQYDKAYAYTEQKIIEHLLLSDIMKIHEKKDGRSETALTHFYSECYGGYGRDGDNRSSVFDFMRGTKTA